MNDANTIIQRQSRRQFLKDTGKGAGLILGNELGNAASKAGLIGGILAKIFRPRDASAGRKRPSRERPSRERPDRDEPRKIRNSFDIMIVFAIAFSRIIKDDQKIEINIPKDEKGKYIMAGIGTPELITTPWGNITIKNLKGIGTPNEIFF